MHPWQLYRQNDQIDDGLGEKCLFDLCCQHPQGVFGILAKVEMESPLYRDKHGVRSGEEFSQQEKGCFLLKAV